jgi:hypothetical protein
MMVQTGADRNVNSDRNRSRAGDPPPPPQKKLHPLSRLELSEIFSHRFGMSKLQSFVPHESTEVSRLVEGIEIESPLGDSDLIFKSVDLPLEP